jgi:hypothetical protein
MPRYLVTGTATVSYQVIVEAKDEALAEEMGEKLLDRGEGLQGHFQWEYFETEEEK